MTSHGPDALLLADPAPLPRDDRDTFLYHLFFCTGVGFVLPATYAFHRMFQIMSPQCRFRTLKTIGCVVVGTFIVPLTFIVGTVCIVPGFAAGLISAPFIALFGKGFKSFY